MTIEHRIRYYLEASRSAPLYHWMYRDKIVGCLADDEMAPLFKHGDMSKPGISLSRNSRFDFGAEYFGQTDHFVRLTLDQDKLAAAYSIIPLDAEHAVRRKNFSGDRDHYRPDRGKGNAGTLMAEEYLIGTIKPLHKYVTALHFAISPLHQPSQEGRWDVDDDDDDLFRYHSRKRTRFVNIATAVYKFCRKWKIRLTVDDEAKWHEFLKELPNLN